MNEPLLLVTPTPAFDESTEGYKLRTTLDNGFEAWVDLRNSYVPKTDWNKYRSKSVLTKLTGHALDALVSREDGLVTIFNDHRIFTKHLNGTKICPECIEEVGYHHGLFDLKAVSACIKHRRLLVDHCPGCVTFLNPDRPGFLQCRCKYDFSKVPRIEISPEVFDLESAIHAIAYRYYPKDTDSQSGMPWEAISALSLNSILSLIDTIGSSVLWSQRWLRRQAEIFDYQITAAAAEVFSNWPHNFNRYLADYSEMRLSPKNKQHTEFKSAYLHQTGVPLPKLETQFILDQYLAYILTDWPKQRDDRKINALVDMPITHYSAHTLYAKISGATPDWVSKQCFEGDLHQVRVINNTPEPRFVLLTHDHQLVDHDGQLYKSEEAAEYLGMSMHLFNSLKASGYLLQKFKVGKYQRFAERDLDNFVEQLQPTNPRAPTPNEKIVTFPMACKLKKRYGIFPLYLLIKILKGEINTINRFTSIDSALLLESEVDRIDQECQLEKRSEFALFSFELRCIDDQMLKQMRALGVVIDQPRDYPTLLMI